MRFQPSLPTLSAAITVVAGLATGAAAQVVATSGGMFVPDTGTASFDYTLQSAGNDIIVGTYIDNAYTPTNAMFAGDAPTVQVLDQRAALFYFADPAASGTVTFDLGGTTSPNGAYFIFEVANVDDSLGFDTSTGAAITTTVDDRYVFNFVGANNTDGATLTTAANSITTLAGVSDSNGSIGGGSIGAASTDDAGVAGAKTLGFDGFGGGFQQGQVALALSVAVPEPTSVAMLGLGGLALLRRRR